MKNITETNIDTSSPENWTDEKWVADKDMRKMSNIVENLIRRHLESKI